MNYVVWVDIPVLDLERAMTFYSKVLDVPLERSPRMEMAVFPHDRPEVAGCLYVADDNRPSQSGPLIYLGVEGRIRAAEDAVGQSGGTVIESVHAIGPFGYRAVVLDSEGNRIALHSQVDA